MTVTAHIADDEPLACRRLRDLLSGAAWLRVIGETYDGPATVEAVNRTRPELLFLDVRMPGLSGFDVLERIEAEPMIVFTTAHDEFAVAAFEARALDYLLKPFGRKRLEACLDRIRQAVEARDAVSAVERGRAALAGDGEPLRVLFVRERGRIRPVQVARIERFEAQDDYVLIHAAGQRHLASLRMNDLERMLDGDEFLRIHRSHIVNVRHVVSFEPHPSGRLQVTMRSGATLFASRSRSRELRKTTL